MIKIEYLKEVKKIKKAKYYSSIILLMQNDDKNIVISDSNGIIHVFDSKNHYDEKLRIIFKKENLNGKNNTINFISLINNNGILITFSEYIKYISLYKEEENNNVVYKYKEITTLSLNLKDFYFYQCISLKSFDDKQLVSSCMKEIIHSWIVSGNNNDNTQFSYRVKKVISVCNKDTSSYLLEIPDLKLLVTCSFKDCVLKFFDLQNNFKLIKTINKIGYAYYEGCISLINSHMLIISSEGIDGMYLVDAINKEIIQQIQINGYKGWINYIFADLSYNDLNPKEMIFYVAGEYEDNKKNFSCDFQKYGIINGEIKLLNSRFNVHDEKISCFIFYPSLSSDEIENKKNIFWSTSKLDIKIWTI